MRRFTAIGARLGLGVVCLAGTLIGSVAAQEAKKAGEAPPSPVGAGWAGQVTSATAPVERVLDAREIEATGKVSVYFNTLANLKGAFVQTGADAKRMRGKFYVKRPGRFRFDYALPSKQVIISDGRFLAIQDLDLGNEDVVELDNTPFRLLLRKDVDLVRDARILEAQETDDQLVVTLQDRSPEAPGRIRLIFAKKPAFDLKEWVTTDAQGLDTRVEVSDLVKTEEIDLKTFQRENLILRKIQ